MATASQAFLTTEYLRFSRYVPSFFDGIEDSGSFDGFTLVSVDKIGVLNVDGQPHFFTYLVDSQRALYRGDHTADEDPNYPTISSNWPLHIPNEVWETIKQSMPLSFIGVVPTQAVFYFRPIQALGLVSNNVRDLLLSPANEVQTAHGYAVKRLLPHAGEITLSYATEECPFKIWTHGSRKQALSGAITKYTSDLTNPNLSESEKATLQANLTILNEAARLEKLCEEKEKHLQDREKKLKEAKARLDQNPSDHSRQRAYANDSKKLTADIDRLGLEKAQVQQQLTDYKSANQSSLPRSYLQATVQAEHAVTGQFSLTKRVFTTHGNTPSTGLLSAADHQVRQNEMAHDDDVHKPYL